MTGRSTCPECSTILRIRDQSFIGRRVNCPECNTVLKVEQPDRDGNFALRRLTSDEVKTARKKKNAASIAQTAIDETKTTTNVSVGKILNSRLTVACFLLVGVIALVAVVSFKSSSRSVTNRSIKTPADIVTPAPTESNESAVETPMASDVPPSPSQTETISPSQAFVELTMDEVVPPISAIEPENYDQPYPWEAEPNTVAAEPVKIDVEGKLSLKIVSYKQPKVARKDLIEALEEQLGAPIRYDREDLGGEGLDEKISFDLQNTTIGGVIEQVAQSAGWQVRIEDTGLRLFRNPPGPQP